MSDISDIARSGKIITLAGAGYPFSIAAVLGRSLQVSPLTLGVSGVWPDIGKELSDANSLIVGDVSLPTAEKREEVNTWLNHGGVMVYFAGWGAWKDIQGYQEWFGVRPILGPNQETLLPGPFPTCATRDLWVRGETELPQARHLTPVTLTTATTLIATKETKWPVLVMNSLGRGKVYSFLTPVNYPSGENWLYCSEWSTLCPEVFVSNKRPASHRNIFHEYAAVHSLLKRRRFKDAQHRIEHLLRQKLPDPQLCEAANLYRWIAGKTNDTLAILFSQRLLIQLIEQMDSKCQTHDYCKERLPELEARQEADRVALLIAKPDSRSSQTLRKLKSQLRSNNAWLPHRKETMRSRIEYIEALVHAVNFCDHAHINARTALDELRSLLHTMNELGSSTYKFRQARALAALLTRLLHTLPLSEVTAEDVRLAEHNRPRSEDLEGSRIIAEDDFPLVTDICQHLLDGAELDARGLANSLRTPLVQQLVNSFITLRGVIDQDPFSVILPLSRLDLSRRKNFAASIRQLLTIRDEGRFVSTNCLLCPTRQTSSERNLPPAGFMSKEGVELIAKRSGLVDVFVMKSDGQTVRGISSDSSRPKDRATTMRSWLKDLARRSKGCAVSTSSLLKTAYFYSANGRVCTWNGRRLLEDSELFDSCRSDVIAHYCELVRDVINRSCEKYHGGVILFTTDQTVVQATSDGSPYPLHSPPDLRRFAAVLGVDGALVVDTENGLLTHFGRTLNPTPVGREQAGSCQQLTGKGKKHLNCLGFHLSYSQKCAVAVFSQDGEATLGIGGNMIKLW